MTNVYAGVHYDVYSKAEEPIKTRANFIRSILDAHFVGELVNKTYDNPQLLPSVRDALSPFQLMSKFWAAETVDVVLHKKPDLYSHVVYVGAWFGLQCSIFSSYGGAPSEHVLIDKDESVLEIAGNCLAVTRRLLSIKGLAVDVADYEIASFASGRKPIIFWTGVEHFEDAFLRDYLDRYEGTGALVCMQGTDLKAPDHINPIRSEKQLESYFHGTPLYSGCLSIGVANRYQVVARL